MIHFIKSATHPYLVNLTRVHEESPTVHLYYEYAPFKLEPWLLAVNENLAIELEEQLIELAEVLTRANFSFKFDPKCLGLSMDMNAKYFLKEFTIDL